MESGSPTWRGSSAERNPGQSLSPFFEDVLSEAQGEGVLLWMRFEEIHHLKENARVLEKQLMILSSTEDSAFRKADNRLMKKSGLAGNEDARAQQEGAGPAAGMT